MRMPIKHIEMWLFIAIAGAMLLGGCSSSETSDLCENIVTASTSSFYFSGSPGTAVRVITSQPAKKFCTAELGIKVRYESDDRARDRAPVNIKVEFAVEDGSGEAATIFPEGEPVYTTVYQRRYIQWGVSVNAADREEPVNYYIRIGTDQDGDFPVLADAVIKYTLYETPRGILH
jgi:hypothetical protein